MSMTTDSAAVQPTQPTADSQLTQDALDRRAKPLVKVRDLKVRYSEDAPLVLEGVDLDLYPGESVALLGSSGSGKSTLMKTLTGFAPITAGHVETIGFSVAGLRQRHLRNLRAQVGQIFQQFNLIGRLSVMTNVMTGSLHRAGAANLFGSFRSADRKRALQLLERVGIVEKAGVEARQLSGGQQQRVAIARALMQNPRVILADEPVASLDPKMSKVVLELLRSIAREENIPVLMSMHNVALALEHSDRIVGLRHGNILVSGPTPALNTEQLAGIYDSDAEEGEE